MNTTQTAQTITLILNGIRNSINDFTLEELTSLLKQNKCPYYNRVTTILKSHNLINKCDKNTYNFCKLSPIYYIIFENSLKKLAKRQNDYIKKWKEKQCKKPVIIDPEQEAILYLKKLGYKIFKEI